jgi:hypothetical protein
MEQPLSGRDILGMMRGETKIMRYSDLDKYDTIEDVLEPYKSVVLLYPMQKEMGHWTLLFYNRNDEGRPIIEFFDPYGYSVDAELNIASSKYKKTKRKLARLLYKSKYPVEYNQYKYQKDGSTINTCGRHVVNRLRHSNLTIKQYHNIFGNDRMPTDQVVTALSEY